MVKVSAPGKLMLFGDHAVVHGRPCIVTAVNHRMSVEMEKREDKTIRISAPEVGVEKYETDFAGLGGEHPKEVRFVLTAARNFFDRYGLESGLEIKTKSEFSSKFGFGSSSAVTVSTIKALAELFGKNMKKKELFDMAYKTVLDIQGVGSGFDVAAAIWGGTLYFVTGGKNIERLGAGPVPLIVGYTGIKADTATLVKMVGRKLEESPKEIGVIFDGMENIAQRARQAIEAGDWKIVGALMDENQELLERLGVSSDELRKLVKAAKGAGAWGAKLSGAGGGDSMIALAEDEGRVKEAIASAGGSVIEVETGVEGVKVDY